MRTSSLTLTFVWIAASLAAAGCTLADGFNFQFADGGGPRDLAAPGADGAAPTDLAALTADGPLMSGRCGAAYERCCLPSAGAPCLGGGCCDQTGQCVPSGGDLLIGTGLGGGVCLNGTPTACGDPNQPCCGRNTCKVSGCCVGGNCLASSATNLTCGGLGACLNAACVSPDQAARCGGAGDPCCDGGAGADFCVASGLACNPGTQQCEPCGDGLSGELCCEGNLCTGAACCVHDSGVPQCLAAGQICGNTTGACASAGCQACGREGQPCCGDNVGCTAPFTTCHSSMCVPCGGSGQPCCAGSRGGFCVEPFACATGVCN